MIEILLGVSILINGFLIWYVVKLIKKFLNISEELEGLFILLEEYAEHVDSVYNLERFYGDTTLEHLMRHSKSIAEIAKNFRVIYDVNYELEEEEDEEEEE
jgi:hypothetical protein